MAPPVPLEMLEGALTVPPFEAIARTIERPVFNLAMRMLANRADAEDATQEILIRTITHLGTVREPAAAGARAFRLACRHLVHQARAGRKPEPQPASTLRRDDGSVEAGRQFLRSQELSGRSQEFAEDRQGC